MLGGGSTEKTTEFQTWGRNGFKKKTEFFLGTLGIFFLALKKT